MGEGELDLAGCEAEAVLVYVEELVLLLDEGELAVELTDESAPHPTGE